MKRFSLGRVLAFVLSVCLAIALWGFVFKAGTTGANVILGLMLVCMMVYVLTLNAGAYFDEQLFHGGNKPRASLLRQALRLIAESKKIIKNRKLNSARLEVFKKAVSELQLAVESTFNEGVLTGAAGQRQVQNLQVALNTAVTAQEALLGAALKASWWKSTQSLILALLCALAIRTWLVEPFQIPSGSMIPTLLVGDHLFVAKLRYGLANPLSSEPSYLIRWANPQPGDVVIFKAPAYVGRNAGEAWVKRVIAVAGQSVQVIDSEVYVDGKPYTQTMPRELVQYLDYFDMGTGTGIWQEQNAWQSTEQINAVKHQVYLKTESFYYGVNNWPSVRAERKPGLVCGEGKCVVQEGYVFVMGDNRCNSTDSRIWGGLPVDAIKGKAQLIWLSVDGSGHLVDLGRVVLPEFRWSRFFQLIH